MITNIRQLLERLQPIDKEMSSEARDMFAADIPYGDIVPASFREDGKQLWGSC